MKIIQIVTQLESGGAQRQAAWLHSALLEDGIDLRLRFLYFKRHSESFSASDCIASKRPKNVSETWALLGLLRGEISGFDVVIAHTHYSIFIVALMKLFFRLRFRLIAVHHSQTSLYRNWLRLGISIMRAIKVIDTDICVADHIVASPKSVVIPNPILSEAMFEIESETVAGLIPDILCVGRLSREKDFATAIRALATTTDRELTLVGDGDYREKLSRICEDLEVRNRVRFMGELAHNDVIHLMQRCKTLLIPSRSEALPMVLLEAIQFSKEIVVSNISAHRFAITAGFATPFEVGNYYDLGLTLSRVNSKTKMDLANLTSSQKEELAKFDQLSILRKWRQIIFRETGNCS